MRKFILVAPIVMFMVCFASAQQALKFTVQPKLITSTSSSIKLQWETSLPTTTEVQYSNGPEMKWHEDQNETTLHELEIDELTASTIYYVRVISKNGKAGIVTPLRQFSTTSAVAQTVTMTTEGK